MQLLFLEAPAGQSPLAGLMKQPRRSLPAGAASEPRQLQHHTLTDMFGNIWRPDHAASTGCVGSSATLWNTSIFVYSTPPFGDLRDGHRSALPSLSQLAKPVWRDVPAAVPYADHDQLLQLPISDLLPPRLVARTL